MHLTRSKQWIDFLHRTPLTKLTVLRINSPYLKPKYYYAEYINYAFQTPPTTKDLKLGRKKLYKSNLLNRKLYMMRDSMFLVIRKKVSIETTRRYYLIPASH